MVVVVDQGLGAVDGAVLAAVGHWAGGCALVAFLSFYDTVSDPSTAWGIPECQADLAYSVLLVASFV